MLLDSEGEQPRSPLLKVLILITAVALAALSWYALGYWVRDDAGVRWSAPQGNCDLHTSACSTMLDEGQMLTLSIREEGPIQALTPLPLDVTLEGVDARQVMVDFVGRDMDMGLHRFRLDRVAKSRSHFAGTGQLGICTLDVMPWRARVIVETPSGRIGSWFDFHVTKS